jgi:hypothetical protein
VPSPHAHHHRPCDPGHPHRDHVELLPDLFGTYQIAQVWDSGRNNDVCGYRAFLSAVQDEPNVAYPPPSGPIHSALFFAGGI